LKNTAEQITLSAPVEFLLPSQQSLIASLGPFSPEMVLLGLCEDNLPFMLDLTSALPGSMLIVGDPGCGKTRLLRAVLTSACLINTSAQVRYYIISPHPEEYDYPAGQPNCAGLFKSRRPEVETLLGKLLDLANQRLLQHENGPAIIVTIDDLADFIHGLNDSALWGFTWLARIGPQLRIWILASQSSSTAGWIGREVLEAFSTRIVGPVKSSRALQILVGNQAVNTLDLSKGMQFYFPFESGWLPVWICESERLLDLEEKNNEHRYALV
jgi:hypothetical protein